MPAMLSFGEILQHECYKHRTAPRLSALRWSTILYEKVLRHVSTCYQKLFTFHHMALAAEERCKPESLEYLRSPVVITGFNCKGNPKKIEICDLSHLSFSESPFILVHCVPFKHNLTRTYVVSHNKYELLLVAVPSRHKKEKTHWQHNEVAGISRVRCQITLPNFAHPIPQQICAR